MRPDRSTGIRCYLILTIFSLSKKTKLVVHVINLTYWFLFQPDGCAGLCKELKVGQVILKVNDTLLHGLEHREAAKVIAVAFKSTNSAQMSLVVTDP